MTKKLLVLTIALAMVACLFGCSNSGNDKKDDTPAGKPTLILILEDGTEKTYELTYKDGDSLRDALLATKLITEDTFSEFFIETIDGYTAKAEDGMLWAVVDEDGEPMGVSMDDVMIKDGETYRLMYYVAPNFDD